MGVCAEIVNHDQLFASLTNVPLIINDYQIDSKDDRDALHDLAITKYTGESLDIVPSCDCGYLKYQYNVGVKCPNCNHFCLPSTERPLEALLWIAAPEGVIKLLNPWVYVILKSELTVNSVSLLDWLINPGYRPPNKKLEFFTQMMINDGYKRGLNSFYTHFDSIMLLLSSEQGPLYDSKKKRKIDYLRTFIAIYRDLIFSHKIPIPSKAAFIIEKAATGLYGDLTMRPAIDAIYTISGIVHSQTHLSQEEIEKRTVTAITMLSEYYAPFIGAQLGSKTGWWRKHVFGSRDHFSFRAVITSRTNQHHYEELELPWSLSVMVFKTHLTAKLLHRGLNPKEINKLLYEHTLKYHPLIDEIFKEMIAESPRKGISVLFQRNPTLTRLSAQRLYVTKVKTDPQINTVSLSVLVLKGLNADFDGDALNGIIILDHQMLESLDELAPRNGVYDTRKPRSISDHIIIPAPVITTISNYIHRGR